jgi:hypothetical protein
MAQFISSDQDWFNHVHSRIESVFLGQLTHRGRFCELRMDEGGKRPVGIWGWNTWCGIHDLTPLAGEEVHRVMRSTFDEGLSRPEGGTGLLPHAVPIDEDGRIGYREGREETYYRTYSGVHGEDYCLDNVICWAKMALEFFLYTRDRGWFDRDRLGAIETSTDYILDELRSAYNPALVESGIEGDWTENSDWHADNSLNNACLLQCLDQLVQVEQIFGREARKDRYSEVAASIREAFRADSTQGGFWHEGRGWFLHGNDGGGARVYGDGYFESSANYFSMLWEIASREQEARIWNYVDSNPEIESPFPVMTNHLPRNHARRMSYGQTVTDGDVWMTLGGHATAARLRAGYATEATRMYKSIIEYELQEGTLHNSIRADGSVDDKWSPEIGNYGAIFTPLVEGVLGLRPEARGLCIAPTPLDGMSRLATEIPLTYAGREFLINIRWKGGTRLRATVDGNPGTVKGKTLLLPPDYEDGSRIEMVYG